MFKLLAKLKQWKKHKASKALHIRQVMLLRKAIQSLTEEHFTLHGDRLPLQFVEKCKFECATVRVSEL